MLNRLKHLFCFPQVNRLRIYCVFLTSDQGAVGFWSSLTRVPSKFANVPSHMYQGLHAMYNYRQGCQESRYKRIISIILYLKSISLFPPTKWVVFPQRADAAWRFESVKDIWIYRKFKVSFHMRYFQISKRLELVNNRLTMIGVLHQVLTEQMEHQHEVKLEWITRPRAVCSMVWGCPRAFITCLCPALSSVPSWRPF